MNEPRLIYDVGMHRGEDTAYYIKRGFRVVGIEADPEHAAYCRAQFAAEIASGQLVLVEGAIAGTDAQTVRFYKNLENSVWGTIDPAWVERNARRGTHHQVFEVPRVDLQECFARYGTPYYLKIDVEGADLLCVTALQASEARPAYLSLESEMKSFARLRGEFDVLEALGYDAFRAVQQANLPARTRALALPGGITHRFEYGCSGPLPEEYPAPWQKRDAVLMTYRMIFMLYRLFDNDSWLWKYRAGRALIRKLGSMAQGEVPGWYDTHARHSSVEVIP
jgi:FkbM family methyltransferase